VVKNIGKEYVMTNKQRVHAALEGKPVDRCPVSASYNYLYFPDHFAELTGRPWWEVHRWLMMPPEEYVAIYRHMWQQTPFELLQTHHAPWADPARIEIVERDGAPYRHDKRTDAWTKLERHSSGFVFDYHANETRHVKSRDDIAAHLPIPDWQAAVAAGSNRYVEAVVREFGTHEFILSGGVVGTVYSCGHAVGQTNLLAMLIEETDLVEALCERITARNLAEIRRIAAAGGDAIYIDDATSTSDMISPAMYERFSLPYMKALVDEIHRLKYKAIVIYFGGVMDRLEQIASTGADGLYYEASMKGFVNDTAEIARRIGDRMTLFSNIDPIAVLQKGTNAELEAEIRRQVEAARPARGFIVSTASPITPATPLARVQTFLEMGRRLGKAR
jgi:hypothetical protein